MESVLENPTATLNEIFNEIYRNTGSEFALSSIHYYLKRNGITCKKVIDVSWTWLFNLSRAPCFFSIQFAWFDLLNDLSNLQVRQIALQRNDELRQMHWANICLFDPDMLVFVDESGFVSSHVTYRYVFFLSLFRSGHHRPRKSY